jgi:nicotinamide-nucleotide adenylyltransferase
MKALFIGRFQPLHNGHLNIIQNASKKYDEIIIGLGSSQYANSFQNPFSSDERQEMIKNSLKQIGIQNYRLELIPDIHDLPRWASYVISIISDFDVIITNSPLTKQLFEEKGYKVEETAIFDRAKYSGKEIRRRIVKDEPWTDLVPEPVVEIIKKIDGVNRLKKLSK